MIKLRVNNESYDVDAHPMRRLLDVLREDCGLTGTKEGCGEGECGACTVLIDGEPVVSCLIPCSQVEGADIQTIEGLGGTHPLQRAFVEHGAAQCGICTPGMIMAAIALGSDPTIDEIREGLAGNICRCTGYEAIYRAVLDGNGSGNGNGTGGGTGNGNGTGTGDSSRSRHRSGEAPS